MWSVIGCQFFINEILHKTGRISVAEVARLWWVELRDNARYQTLASSATVEC